MSNGTLTAPPPLISRGSSLLVGDVDPNTEIFGVTLSKAMSLDEGRTLLASQDIPTLLDLILCNLEYKVLDAEVFVNADPHSAAVTNLRNNLNKGTLPATINGEPDVLSGLLRRYLLELPEPLVPVSHYKPLLALLTSSKKFKNGKDKGGASAVKQIVDDVDFSKVHFHALRRVCGLLRTMLNSWWSDSGEARQVLDLMAISIMRPDNLNRTATSPKELNSIKEAVANLIAHSNTIFITTREHSDSNARRVSMIRKGERASRLQLMVDAENGNNEIGSARGDPTNTRARRLSNVGGSLVEVTPRHDNELRQEFKAYRESTTAEIAELRQLISDLTGQVSSLRRQLTHNGNDTELSANESDYDDCETPPGSPKARRTDSAARIPATAVPPVAGPGTSNPASSALAAAAYESPKKARVLRQESLTKSVESSKSADVPSKRDSVKDLSEEREDTPKKHKHKKER